MSGQGDHLGVVHQVGDPGVDGGRGGAGEQHPQQGHAAVERLGPLEQSLVILGTLARRVVALLHYQSEAECEVPQRLNCAQEFKSPRGIPVFV